MPTTRVMSGIADLTGEKCGTLRVQSMVSRRPEPRYSVVCDRCGTESTAVHSRLRTGAAVCRNGGCGKAQKSRGRDLLTEQREQAAERERQRREDERAASTRRMEAESDGWERPQRYAPAPDQRPTMSAREVTATRERRAAAEAEQRLLDAPRLEAERHEAEDRNAAEAEKRQRTERQRAYWAQWVSEDRDPKFFITPTLVTASMSRNEANAHNLAEVEKFTDDVPEFAGYKTPENAALIVAYLRRNGANIYDSAMLKAAFIRLRDLGLLTQKVAPAEQPAPVQQPSSTAVEAQASSGPRFYRGRDYATGLERNFSAREVERMSSDEYRRAFAVVPTVSELFSRMRDADE